MAHNPFGPSKSRPGYGEVYVAMLQPNTPVLKALNYTYPLKLISSSPHVLGTPKGGLAESTGGADGLRPMSVPLLFMLTYGGGLVPPDSVSLHATLEPSTRLTLATQGSTKVFPSTANALANGSATQVRLHADAVPTAEQQLHIKLGPGSALLLAPDPVQPFAGSYYSQIQIFDLERDASLGLLDWVSSGRPARDEIWDTGAWTGRNEIWRVTTANETTSCNDRRLLLRDALYLEGGPNGIGQKMLREEKKGVFGTLILVGPIFEAMGAFFLTEFSSQPKMGGHDWDDDADTSSGGVRHPQQTISSLDADGLTDNIPIKQWRSERLRREIQNDVLWTATKVRGLVVVKFAAREVEGAKGWLHDMFQRDGTVLNEFGPGGLISVQ